MLFPFPEDEVGGGIQRSAILIVDGPADGHYALADRLREVAPELTLLVVEPGEEYTELLERSRRRDRAVIESLAAAVEAKDQTTHRHLRAVVGLARALAALVDPQLAASEDFHNGCLLHDVGKIGVPEHILTKPAPLSSEEWIVMRAHPITGVRVIEPLEPEPVVRDVVLHHHERWDGRGYPYGLGEDEIPLAARIFSVCDALDAMLSHRPYRRAIPTHEALERVRAEAGTQFDPAVVEALDCGLAAGVIRLSMPVNGSTAHASEAPEPASLSAAAAG